MGGPGSGRKRKVADPSVSPPKKSPKRKRPSIEHCEHVQEANNENQEDDASHDHNEELGCPLCDKVFKSSLVLKVHLEKNICQKKKATTEKARCASKPTDTSAAPSAQTVVGVYLEKQMERNASKKTDESQSTEKPQTNADFADNETQSDGENHSQTSSLAKSTTSQSTVVVVVTKGSKNRRLGLIIDRTAFPLKILSLTDDSIFFKKLKAGMTLSRINGREYESYAEGISLLQQAEGELIIEALTGASVDSLSASTTEDTPPEILRRQIHKRFPIPPRSPPARQPDVLWETSLFQFLSYRIDYPDTAPSPISDLGYWVAAQNSSYKQIRDGTETSPLVKRQIQVLESINFPFELDLWDKKFNLLKEYRAKNGHVDVPSSDLLGRFVRLQRERMKKSRLSQERIEKLDSLGFKWNIQADYKDSWEKHIKLMQEFRAKHGHVDVPYDSGPLGLWVNAIRHKLKKKNSGKNVNLTDERIEFLNSLGFKWKIMEDHDTAWDTQYNELLEFYRTNGHSNVLQKSGFLGGWVSRQRHLKKQGKLSEDRSKKLEDIGFVWVLKEGSGNFRGKNRKDAVDGDKMECG